MAKIDLGQVVLWIEPSWMCDCQHDTCFLARGDARHGRSCECPKDRRWVELTVTDPRGDLETAKSQMLRPARAEEIAAGVQAAFQDAAQEARAA